MLNSKLLLYLTNVLIFTIFLACGTASQANEPTIQEAVKEVKPLGPLNSTKKFSELKISPYALSDQGLYQDIILKNLSAKISDQDLRNGLIGSLLKSAEKYKINPIFLMAVAEVGSGLKPDFQKEDRLGFLPLNDAKAKYISKLYSLPYADRTELLDYEKNLTLAGAYFGFLSEVYQDNYEHYLLAYNWNAEALGIFLKGRQPLPKQHQLFLNQVLKAYNHYQRSDPQNEQATQNADQGESAPVATESTEKTIVATPSASSEEQVKKVDPFLQIVSTKPLPNYYLNTKNRKSPKEYYQLLLDIALVEKISIVDPQIILNMLIEQSFKASIDPIFVFSMVKNSSNFNPSLNLNQKFGLMQIGLAEAKLASEFLGITWPGDSALLKPDISLSLGLGYLKICHNIFDNNSFQSLAGYRWGVKNLIEAVKHKAEIPPLVIRYPQQILEDYKRFLKPQKSTSTKSAGVESSTGSSALQKFVCSSSKDLVSCKKLASLIKKEAEVYHINPIEIARYAEIQSNLRADLQQNNRFGLFQWSPEQAEKIAAHAQVAWAGQKELLKPEYSIRMACKYYNFLHTRFKGNKLYVALGLFWNLEELNEVIKTKGIIPNDVNSKVTNFLQKSR